MKLPKKYKETKEERAKRLTESRSMGTKSIIPKKNYNRTDNKKAIYDPES
jgi:hypothetical protein